MFVVPSLRRAGAETQAIDLINNIDQLKFNKYLYTFENEIDLIDHLNQEQTKYFHRQRRSKYDLSIVRYLASIIDSENIEIIHCTLLFSLLIAWLAIRISKRKPRIVISIHTTTQRSFKYSLQEKVLYQWLLRGCTRIIFVCNKQRDYWVNKYSFMKNMSLVIHNGINSDHYKRNRFSMQANDLLKSLSIPDESFVICCIAGFRREKGHINLLTAFSYLQNKPFLLLAGDGEEKSTISKLVTSMGLNDRVRFLGNVSDVRPLLAASDVSVLASTAVETFSMAMLESMCMEVPVIATDIGGLSEAVITGKTGILVKVGDINTLRAAFEKTMRNTDEVAMMGQAARKLVIKQFSRDLMVKKTEDLLCSVSRSSYK